MKSDSVSDSRLALAVTHADGRSTRWGPDEPNPTEIPGDLTFSTQIPGGFKDMSCSLLRRIDLDYSDLGLFDSVTVYGPGGRTAWEGRMAQFPRSHGDGFQIVPGAVGWSAHLTDDPTFQEVYVDRDMGRWGEMLLVRKLAVASSSISMGDFAWTSTDGQVVVLLPNSALGGQTWAETDYLAPAGVTIASVSYIGSTVSAPAYQLHFVGLDSTGTTTAETVTPTMSGALQTATFGTPRRYCGIRLYSNGTAVTPTAGATIAFSKLAAYGAHGLTKRSNGTDPSGFYASDVIQDIVSRTAPLLNLGEIEATSFVIPHLEFSSPTTGEDAIQYTNAYHGFDWGVYDNREFFFRESSSTRLTWEARLSEGARLDLEGDTAEQVFNGVFVTYQDANGQRKTVGPPGANADTTNASLEDTSPTNPVNAHGIPRRWGMLEVSQVTSTAGATQLGAIWLAAHAAPQRRGTLTLTGSATHPTEGRVPTWRVRAGDYVSIADHPSSAPRKIIETRYSHGSGQVTCNLDNTPYVLDAILARMGVGLVGVL